MHSVWNFFLKNQAFTYLLMVSLTLGGVYSLLAIPKESSPEVIVPIGIVATPLRGASALDVETLITNKIEDEVTNVEGIDKVTSVSKEGFSVVTAQFDAKADVDKSIDMLKEAVDKAVPGLPLEADAPVVTKVNFSDQPILIVTLTTAYEGKSLSQLRDAIEDEIKKVKGVSKVEISGVPDRQVSIFVKKEALVRYNLSLPQITQAIRSANASLPAGSIVIDDVEYPILFSGSLESAQDVASVQVGTAFGVPVFVRDIASVVDELKKTVTLSRASVGGSPAERAITVNVFKKAGGDVTAISDDVKEKFEELKGSILSDAEIVVSFDRGDLVKKDLRELTQVGLETILLVMLVLVLTIGWRESVVAGLSIPLSFVIAFIGLYASGNTINFVSLFSLILAIGILVDSGIVVAEAIHTRMSRFGNAEKAAYATIKEYAWPLIAGTMTTVAVFVPLFFISGVTGKFIASIPFTLIFVLLASIVVALGMVPLLAVKFTKPHRNKFEEKQERYSEMAREWYKNKLKWVLENRKFQNRLMALMGLGFIISLTLPIFGLLKVEFFPQSDQDFVFITIELPQGSTINATDIVTRQVEEILYDKEYISSFVTTIGSGSSFDEGSGGVASKLANITVNLPKKRDLSSTEIVELLREDLSSITTADVSVSQGNNGPPSGAPVVIKFKGDDMEALSKAAAEGERVLENIAGTIDVETSLKSDGSLFELSFDKEVLAQVGVSPLALAETLRTAVAGSISTSIKKNSEDIDIVVLVDLKDGATSPDETSIAYLEDVLSLPVQGKDSSVLLGSILSSELKASKASIFHDEGKRVVQVSSRLKEGVTALEVTGAFRSQLESVEIPEGVAVSYGGEDEEVNQSFRDMFLALIAGMVGMLAILVLEFNSFRYALYLLGIVPLSLIGVLGGLTLTGQTLSFSSMLGFIALSGVIINHAIILLDSIIRALEEDTQSPLMDVVVESSAVRLRPIFLTTVTTVVGMIPLAGVSALWGPLAFAIMFGLMFAMILTLIVVPVLFYRSPGKLTR